LASWREQIPASQSSGPSNNLHKPRKLLSIVLRSARSRDSRQ
jgi:hypothetical protein